MLPLPALRASFVALLGDSFGEDAIRSHPSASTTSWSLILEGDAGEGEEVCLVGEFLESICDSRFSSLMCLNQG